MSAQDLLTDLSHKDVRLSADGPELVVDGPVDVLTNELIEQLRTYKADLLATLRQSEAEAARRVFEYKLSDSPGRWLVMIAAPGEDLAAVERGLRGRFGPERVLAVRAYQPSRQEVTQ